MFDRGSVTDEHLPVINGVGVLEDVEHSSDGRVLHVEGETGVAVLELLDGLCRGVLGIVLERSVRKAVGRMQGSCRAPFGTWRRTWTWWRGRGRVGWRSVGRTLIREGAGDMMNFRLVPTRLAGKKRG